MILPSSPLLRSEDYDKTVQGWIGRLLSPLNSFISNVTNAINGRLTFTDNMTGVQKALAFSFSANTLPISFAVSSTQQNAFTPTALEVVGATENGNPVCIQAAWSYTSGNVKITDLIKLASGAASSLVSGASYKVTVRVSP